MLRKNRVANDQKSTRFPLATRVRSFESTPTLGIGAFFGDRQSCRNSFPMPVWNSCYACEMLLAPQQERFNPTPEKAKVQGACAGEFTRGRQVFWPQLAYRDSGFAQSSISAYTESLGDPMLSRTGG